MNFDDCLKNRFSCRDFCKDFSLDNDTLTKLAKLAYLSPSASNMQEVKLCFVSNNILKTLKQELLKAFYENSKKSAFLNFYPANLAQNYKDKRFLNASKLYGLLNINKDDKNARLKQWTKNYEFFNANNAAFIYIDKDLDNGAIFDAGIFSANLINAATSLNINTCFQASVCEYNDIISNVLNINNVNFLCAIALGKATKDKINSFRSEKRAEFKIF